MILPDRQVMKSLTESFRIRIINIFTHLKKNNDMKKAVFMFMVSLFLLSCGGGKAALKEKPKAADITEDPVYKKD